jgi:hypothetical protein
VSSSVCSCKLIHEGSSVSSFKLNHVLPLCVIANCFMWVPFLCSWKEIHVAYTLYSFELIRVGSSVCSFKLIHVVSSLCIIKLIH